MQRALSAEEPTPRAALLDGASFAWLDTPVGEVSLLAGPKGLRACWLQRHPWEALAAKGARLPTGAAGESLSEARRQILEYFREGRREFDLQLDPWGTPFQLRVWEALRAIPFGQARSYAQIAQACGSPKGFRAVGGANGRNPIPIVIPCHRAIASGGAIGGFSSGLERKRALLAHEGIVVKG